MAGGLQIAVTQFHAYNHRWMLSVRFPFLSPWSSDRRRIAVCRALAGPFALHR